MSSNSNAINVVGAINGIKLVYDIIRDGRKLYQKSKEYSRDEWGRSDYSEAGATIASLGAGLFRIKAGVDQWACELDLSDYSHKIESYNETLQEIQRGKDPYYELVKDREPEIRERLDKFITKRQKIVTVFQKSKESAALASLAKTLAVTTKKVARGESSVAKAFINSEVVNEVGAALCNVGLARGDKNLCKAGEVLQKAVVAVEVFSIVKSIPFIKSLVDRVTDLVVNYNRRRLPFDSGPGLTIPTVYFPPQDDDYAFIPASHNENVVFSQYLCGITHAPIRYPCFVLINGVKQSYELLNLIMHIYRNGVRDTGELIAQDPVINQPITIGDVHMDINAQKAIENEMRRLGILQSDQAACVIL